MSENIFQGATYQVISGDSSPVTNEPIQATEPAPAAQPESVTTPEPNSATQQTQPVTPEPAPAPQPAPPVDPWLNITEQDVVKRFDKKALLKAAGLDDFALDAVEYYQRTGNLADYAEVKTVDWNKVSDESLMLANLREKYAALNLSGEELEAVVQDEWRETRNRLKIDPDTFSESEVSVGRLKLKAEVDPLRRQKIEHQQKFKAPEVQPAAQPEQTDPVAQLEQAKQNILAQPAVKQFLADKKITLGNGETAYNYEVNPDEILGLLYDGQQFAYHTAIKNEQGQIRTNEQGHPIIDYAKMVKMAAFLKDPDAYERNLINHGKQLGEKSLVDAVVNPSNIQSRGAGIIEPQNVWQAAKSGGVRLY